MSTTSVPSLVYGGRLVARLGLMLALFASTWSAGADEVLFPHPLHLTRTVDDPIARQTFTVEQYCAANRVITVRRDRVVIEDYSRQELTEIDRVAGTYSVTSFSELAKTKPAPAHVTAATGQSQWKRASRGVTVARGRALEMYELTTDRGSLEHVEIEVAVDRSISLSRAAVEVLIGAAFPSAHTDEHKAILVVARRPGNAHLTTDTTAANDDYGLPVEQVTSFEVGSERLVQRNTIIGIDTESSPANLLLIPPGSTRVESRSVRLARELRALDQLPPAPAQR